MVSKPKLGRVSGCGYNLFEEMIVFWKKWKISGKKVAKNS